MKTAEDVRRETEELGREVKALTKGMDAFKDMARISKKSLIAMLCVAVDYCASEVEMDSVDLLMEILPRIADINERMGKY